MEDGLIRKITITCSDDKDQLRVGNAIHEQLRGNPDYVNNNIILNIDVKNEVNMFIYEDCKEIPTILI